MITCHSTADANRRSRNRNLLAPATLCINSPPSPTTHQHFPPQNPIGRTKAFLVMEMGADDRWGKWMILRGDTLRKTLELGPEFGGYNVSGYVNGVLFFWHDYRLIMWNPSVQRGVEVPDYINFSLSGLVFGFGFDALNNDYKVVKIGNPPGWDVSHASSVLAVFSFRSGCWREVDVAVRIRCHDQSIFFKGTIYWLSGKTVPFYIEKGRELVSFDVHSDALGYVDVPKHDEKELLRLKLGIVHDSLALLDISRERSTIWLMDKDWETIQWTKRYSVEIDGFFLFLSYIFLSRMLGFFLVGRME
ncbi:putative F-box protein [Drosera capensis]